jgi:hypothetical protein
MTIDNARQDRRRLIGDVDFAMMYAAHDAFTRSIERLAAATEGGQSKTPRALGQWNVLKTQLHIHHTAEDTLLWPKLRAAVTNADESAVLDAMEREHAMLDPMLDGIDAAVAVDDVLQLAEFWPAIRDALGRHMQHEEDAALPLVAHYLGAAGWAAFGQHIRKTQGLSGAAVYVPWLLDGAPEPTAAAVLAMLPAPARLLYRLVWLPKYRRTAGL